MVRETTEAGDICIHKADSLCYTAETNTTSQSNYIPINLNIYISPFKAVKAIPCRKIYRIILRNWGGVSCYRECHVRIREVRPG